MSRDEIRVIIVIILDFPDLMKICCIVALSVKERLSEEEKHARL